MRGKALGIMIRTCGYSRMADKGLEKCLERPIRCYGAKAALM